MMPPSYQPLSTRLMATACSTATVGPQPTEENVLKVANATNAATRMAFARMRRILEHPHLDPAERFLLLEGASQIGQQIGAAQSENASPRTVGRRQARTVVVAASGDRQPVRCLETERAAVLEHRLLQRLNHFGAVRFA